MSNKIVKSGGRKVVYVYYVIFGLYCDKMFSKRCFLLKVVR